MNAIVEPKNELAAAQAPQLPIRNYNEFYRFYLTEHRNITSRRLHVLGSAIGGYFIAKAIRQRKPKYVLYGLLPGYACAWVGHFMFASLSASFVKDLIPWHGPLVSGLAISSILFISALIQFFAKSLPAARSLNYGLLLLLLSCLLLAICMQTHWSPLFFISDIGVGWQCFGLIVYYCVNIVTGKQIGRAHV